MKIVQVYLDGIMVKNDHTLINNSNKIGYEIIIILNFKNSRLYNQVLSSFQI